MCFFFVRLLFKTQIYTILLNTYYTCNLLMINTVNTNNRYLINKTIKIENVNAISIKTNDIKTI